MHKFSKKLPDRKMLAVFLSHGGDARIYKVGSQLNWEPVANGKAGIGFLMNGNTALSVADTENAVESAIATHLFAVAN